MLNLSILLQDVSTGTWSGLGVGGGIAALVFYFYRQDREDSQKKYSELSINMRQLVEDNTRAITANTEVVREALGAIRSLSEMIRDRGGS